METSSYSTAFVDNYTPSLPNATNTTDVTSAEELLLNRLGPQRRAMAYVVLLLVIYGLIFISGTVGNVCTCVVIVRNSYMQTTTNYYLFSLAISDVLILLLGLPPEAYSIWEAYPWRFGKVFCYIKRLVAEMTSYASVLTITAFTVERYLAVCHPLKAHKIATFSRCIKIIILIWLVSLACALPYPLHTELFYYIRDANGDPVLDSLQCNIPWRYYERMTHMFQASTFLFFVFPLTVIIVLYVLIGLSLRKSDLQRTASTDRNHVSNNHCPSSRHESSSTPQPRKCVLRVLVAVVVAFFICWAPFHAQRLLTVYNREWTPVELEIQSTLFYISGVLYFIGSTVNPILYNLMSRRYRLAFKETICNLQHRKYQRSFQSHQSSWKYPRRDEFNHLIRKRSSGHGMRYCPDTCSLEISVRADRDDSIKRHYQTHNSHSDSSNKRSSPKNNGSLEMTIRVDTTAQRPTVVSESIQNGPPRTPDGPAVGAYV